MKKHYWILSVSLFAFSLPAFAGQQSSGLTCKDADAAPTISRSAIDVDLVVDKDIPLKSIKLNGREIAHNNNTMTIDTFYTGWNYEWDSKNSQCYRSKTYNGTHATSEFISKTKKTKVNQKNCTAFRVAEKLEEKLGGSCKPNYRDLKLGGDGTFGDNGFISIDKDCLCSSYENYTHIWKMWTSIITDPPTAFDGPRRTAWGKTREITENECASLMPNEAGRRAVHEAYAEVLHPKPFNYCSGSSADARASIASAGAKAAAVQSRSVAGSASAQSAN